MLFSEILIVEDQILLKLKKKPKQLHLVCVQSTTERKLHYISNGEM